MIPGRCSSPRWHGCIGMVLVLIATGIAFGQEPSISQLGDLPLTAELEAWKQRLATQPMPVDSSSLYNEIQRLQYVRQRLSDIRNQRSAIDSLKETLEAKITSLEGSLADLKSFCSNAPTASQVNSWWVTEHFGGYKALLASAAEYVRAPADPVKDPARPPKSGETCQSYGTELRTVVRDLRKTFGEYMVKYQQIEQEKLKNIADVDGAYKTRIELMTRELETARQRQQEDRATTIAQNLWVMILVLGGTAIIILTLVRWFPEKAQLELVQSGQVIQFITVLLLLTVIMSLGLSGIIKENTLGTLLGGLGGYVLSQGVGRAAVHGTKKKQPGENDETTTTA